MQKLLASAAAAALFTSPAFAGALIFEPEPEPVVEVAPAPAPLPIPSWTGPFVGLQVGWGSADVDVDAFTGEFVDTNGNIFDVITPDFGADDDDFVYGAQLGYDYDFGNGFVLGGEVAYVRAEAEPSTTATAAATDAAGNEFDVDFDGSVEIDHLVRLTARGGYSLGNTLLYLKGGGVWLDGETSAAGVSDSRSDWGWVAGAGVEHMFTDNVSGRLEYLYHEVDDFDDSGIDVELQTVTLGVNYRF